MFQRITQSAAIVATLFTAAAAWAATPSSGTLTMTDGEPSDTLTYNSGPMPVPNASGLLESNYTCDTTNPCDHYELTIDLPADFRSTHPAWRVEVKTAAIPAAADIDLQISDLDGNVVHLMRDNPPAQPTITFQPAGGLETLIVQIVPGTSVPDATATIRLYEDSAFLGEEKNAIVGGPTFAEFRAPPSMADNGAAEPTMGINLADNSAYYIDTFNVLRLDFDDNTWSDLGTGGALTTADPFMTMDPYPLADGSANPRVWIAQLMAATSYIAFTDDNGANWTTSITGPGQVHGVDNQSITVGPYPAEKPLTAAAGSYEHAVYYCSHEGVNAFCSRSDDGGLTFNTSRPIFPVDAACSNHGHVKVGYDGTVMVPMNNTCQGTEGVSISIDAGETWHYISVPGTQRGRWDSSIAMSNDGKTVWYGYGEEGDDRAMIVKGELDKSNPDNPTIHWELPALDVGAPHGLVNIVFPTVVAGDSDRAAYAFHGTTFEGDSGTFATMNGAVWHLYISTTFDGGKTWETRRVSDDPVQRNDVCDQGTTCLETGNHRNLLDFMDMDIDAEGRLVLVYADGCVGACALDGGTANYADQGVFVRQVSGKRMYAQFDPLDSEEPGTPSLSGTRDETGVSLAWNAVNSGTGGSLTGYGVEQSTDGVNFTEIANVTGTDYVDNTAIDPALDYSYRVRAFNSGGFASAYSDVVTLGLDQGGESVCALPGLTLITDDEGDHEPPFLNGVEGLSASHDLLEVSVVEPFTTDAPLNTLIFRIRVADLTAPAPNTIWQVEFTTTDGVERWVQMKTDTLSTADDSFTTYDYGRVDVVGVQRLSEEEGSLEAGSGYNPETGEIILILDADKIQNLDTGNKVLGPTAPLSAVAGSVLQTVPGYVGGTGGGSLQPVDETGTVTYTRAGNASCAPNELPTAVLAVERTYNEVPGQSITVDFDATGSSDPDGSIAGYRFVFGDGAEESNTTGVATHVYNGTAGEAFGARVIVTDDLGGVSSPSTMAQVVIPDEEIDDTDTDGDGILDKDEKEGCVDDPDPACGDDGQTDNGTLAAALNCALADAQNDPYTFDCTASSSYVEGGTVNAPQYKLVAGDGSETAFQGSASFQHSYDAAGEYRAFVVARDANGNSAVSDEVVNEVVITISVSDDGENAARLKVDKATGPAPLTVTFDAGSSTVAAGYHITGYAWDFDGDGGTDFQSSTAVVQHVYTSAGEFTPSVTVSYSNDDGSDTPSSVAKAAVAATAPGSTPVQQSAGGGSLGWLVLLPLFGGALIRRRRG